MHLAEDSRPANGGTEYGRNAVSGLMQEEKAERGAVQQLTNEQDHVLKSFRPTIQRRPSRVLRLTPTRLEITDMKIEAQSEWQPSEWLYGSM
jgi:hypothetical protein